MRRDPGQGPSAVTLRLIRISLLLPVVLFGAVVAFLVQRDGPGAPEAGQVLQYVNIAYLVAAAAGVLYFQRRHAAERDPSRRATLNVIAWALGESTALFGAVHYLLVGSAIPYLVGLAMLVASFVLVPVRNGRE